MSVLSINYQACMYVPETYKKYLKHLRFYSPQLIIPTFGVAEVRTFFARLRLVRFWHAILSHIRTSIIHCHSTFGTNLFLFSAIYWTFVPTSVGVLLHTKFSNWAAIFVQLDTKFFILFAIFGTIVDFAFMSIVSFSNFGQAVFAAIRFSCTLVHFTTCAGHFTIFAIQRL